MSFYQPGQPVQQQGFAQSSQRQATVIGEWSARANNLEFGKYLEFQIERVQTQRGGSFDTFSIFKPYITKSGPNAGKEGKGFSIPFPNGIRELVDTINKMIQMYAPEKGQYVFHPSGGMQQQAPQQYQQPAQPQYTQPQAYAAPTHSYAPQQGYNHAPVVAQNPGFAGYPDSSLAPTVGNTAPVAPQGNGYPPYPGQR